MDQGSHFAKRLVLICSTLLTACSQGGGSGGGSSVDYTNPHQELAIVDPAASGSDQSTGMVSSQGVGSGTVRAQLVTIGSVYLETQLLPLTVTGTTLQASDVSANGVHAYVTYSAVDSGGVITKKGAVQHVTAASCDNPLTGRTEYCLSPNMNLLFPDADLNASFTDGTNLWVTGSTTDETFAPQYGRVYKVALDSNADPTSVSVTQAIASYAGTGLVKVGSNLLVTSGSSTNATYAGGLSVLDAATLAPGNFRPYFDARAVGFNAIEPSRAYVVRGAVDGTNLGAVADFPVDASANPSREISTGGNTIPESKSTLLVGKTLLLTTRGDQGFRVSCKATGASLATVPAPVVSGIPSNLTVTNSVAALPGFILAANGEAGVYLYQFQKTSALQSDYCSGVTLTLVGRLSLASSGYVNGELSANSVRYLPVLNVLNLITAKLIVIASGNKGVSLLNMGGLSLSLTDVDDF